MRENKVKGSISRKHKW